jgi:hypothetical protein
MGLTDPVTDGFVVINKASSTITKPDIVNAIQNSREFGKGSIYDTENWVYLISNNRALEIILVNGMCLYCDRMNIV